MLKLKRICAKFELTGDFVNIVITDARTVTDGDISLASIEKLGYTTIYETTSKEEVAQRIERAQAVLCNKTLLDAETLKGAKNLRYIGLFATGYNNIDIQYTKENGITVCNAVNYSTEAVAQHVFALILNNYNKIYEYKGFVNDGEWIKSPVFSPFVFPMTELSGKIIGIIGYGNIAKAVIRIAHAFGMKVLVFTRSLNEDKENLEFVNFDTLLNRSDIISVHCPLNKQSMRMFNGNAFEKCKKGMFFVNTARGGIVDERALLKALESGKLSGAALDVLNEEPMSSDCVLLNAPNLTITPHVSWAAKETRQRLVDIVVDNLECFIKGKPKNLVIK